MASLHRTEPTEPTGNRCTVAAPQETTERVVHLLRLQTHFWQWNCELIALNWIRGFRLRTLRGRNVCDGVCVQQDYPIPTFRQCSGWTNTSWTTLAPPVWEPRTRSRTVGGRRCRGASFACAVAYANDHVQQGRRYPKG